MLVRDDVRVLLIQARTDASILEQELSCFADRTKLSKSQFNSRNVVEGTGLTHDIVDNIDVCMIGGAGEFSAVDDYPWMDELLEFIRVLVRRDTPLFGSCWGHQLAARALGGVVIHDLEKAEMGCREIELTEAGMRDDLLGKFPRRFFANMGHHDRVTKLPPGAVELARSESQPHQAFRLVGAPVYGTQFHSELDAESERTRLITYREHYIGALPNEEEFNKVLAELRETTEVDELLSLFIDQFVLSDGS